MHWRAAAHYNAANDHTALRTVAKDLRGNYPSSVGPNEPLTLVRPKTSEPWEDQSGRRLATPGGLTLPPLPSQSRP